MIKQAVCVVSPLWVMSGHNKFYNKSVDLLIKISQFYGIVVKNPKLRKEFLGMIMQKAEILQELEDNEISMEQFDEEIKQGHLDDIYDIYQKFQKIFPK